MHSLRCVSVKTQWKLWRLVSIWQRKRQTYSGINFQTRCIVLEHYRYHDKSSNASQNLTFYYFITNIQQNFMKINPYFLSTDTDK